ncbi:MAG: hypothetical protein GF320_00270 [Armatimonadia bacterium]|nr:hypothetical protein [Armatimonadia bacterium]
MAKTKSFMAPMLGQILLRQGSISVGDLDQALAIQELTGERLGQVLVGMDIIDQEQLDRALVAMESYSG